MRSKILVIIVTALLPRQVFLYVIIYLTYYLLDPLFIAFNSANQTKYPTRSCILPWRDVI